MHLLPARQTSHRPYPTSYFLISEFLTCRHFICHICHVGCHVENRNLNLTFYLFRFLNLTAWHFICHVRHVSVQEVFRTSSTAIPGRVFHRKCFRLHADRSLTTSSRLTRITLPEIFMHSFAQESSSFEEGGDVAYYDPFNFWR